jgi:pimeloyl-ACP methyl ester carboxylesterase
MPVLAIAGTLDERYVTIARQMVSRIGANATLAEVDAAGHTTHLEAATVTARVINEWLASSVATTRTR